RRVLCIAKPRRGSPAARKDRLRRRAFTSDARHPQPDGTPRPGRDVDLRRSGRGHRRPRRRRGGEAATGSRRGVPGAVHHPSAADRGARRCPVRDHQADSRWPDDHSRGEARWTDTRIGARADDRGRRYLGRGPGERCGNAAISAKGERRTQGERRKRRSPGEGTDVSRKYLIETYGCQMNYHDSEQMAGLLESAGYDRTEDDREADVVVINTCSVREHAEEKLYTRLGELRVLGEETGRDPLVAVAGCVAQQEGAKLLKRS